MALKRPIRLRRYYLAARVLFCEMLHVRPANIKHAVSEFRELSNEDSEDQVRRCEKLLKVLDDFVRNGSIFDTADLIRIQTAQSFSVLNTTDLSNEDRIVRRSLCNDQWYIPDKVTLEGAFRGRLELLDMDVSVVQSLKQVFIAMRCEDKFLSNAVQEDVEPRGDVIRDLEKEEEFKIRAEHIAWYVQFCLSRQSVSTCSYITA